MANDLYRAGGIPLVAKRLLEAGLIHGDTMTVTGRTLAEEAAGDQRNRRARKWCGRWPSR